MSLPIKGRLLALDIGTVRTGISVCDGKQQVAFSRDEIETQSKGDLIQKLKKLIKKEEVVGILIGLPLNLQGLEGKQAAYSREIVALLQKEVDLPVEWIDERLSTQLARRSMEKRQIVDSECAQLLLSLYLQRT